MSWFLYSADTVKNSRVWIGFSVSCASSVCTAPPPCAVPRSLGRARSRRGVRALCAPCSDGSIVCGVRSNTVSAVAFACVCLLFTPRSLSVCVFIVYTPHLCVSVCGLSCARARARAAAGSAKPRSPVWFIGACETVRVLRPGRTFHTVFDSTCPALQIVCFDLRALAVSRVLRNVHDSQ